MCEDKELAVICTFNHGRRSGRDSGSWREAQGFLTGSAQGRSPDNAGQRVAVFE